MEELIDILKMKADMADDLYADSDVDGESPAAFYIRVIGALRGLQQQRDELLDFMHEIERVKPETKDLWIHTVKCKAAALIAKVKGCN